LLVPTLGSIPHDIGEGSPMYNNDESTKMSSSSDACNYVYVLPFGWMGKNIWIPNKQQGDLFCNSKKCNSLKNQEAVGHYDWNGLNCTCGAIFRPGFGLYLNKVKHN